VIDCALIEADDSFNGVGIVKLMGREAVCFVCVLCVFCVMRLLSTPRLRARYLSLCPLFSTGLGFRV
jgi:hypothetical protein